MVEERAGLAPPSCPSATEEAISRAMARAGLTDLEAYRARLAEDSAALDDLLTELTIGETYFFRTPEHFEHLRRVVLPELNERRGPTHTLRLWSAACASGEEPYSLAVLLRDEGWSHRMSVYATDVSRGALARARQANYGEWSLRGPWEGRMRAHLRPEGRRYVLAPEIRELVRFGYLNLALDTWPSADSGIWKLDVIFCRNVLIYFNPATIEGVARRLHDALAEGGYLFTGPSDPPLGALAPLEPVLTDWGVLYRRPLPGTVVSIPAVGFAPAGRAGEAAPPVPRGDTAGDPKGSASWRSGADAPMRLPGTKASGVPGSSAPLAPPTPRTPRTPPASGSPAPDLPPASVLPVPGASPDRALRAPDAEALAAARRALDRGDWREAARRLGAEDAHPDIATMAVRTLANLDAQAAIAACAETAARHPLIAGLRYLEALLQLGQGRLADAERAARQALYLEPTLIVAWLVLGRVLRRHGDTAGALRAWREAESLCAVLAPEVPVPLADGESARALAEVARSERIRLEAALATGEDTP
nr:protein-glutamate O-methyltransferase CheR [Pyxidicoccus fallax]